MTTDLFDVPMTDEERAEVAAMASHELYFLTKMIPPATVRGREVIGLYHECIDRAIAVAPPRSQANTNREDGR